MHEHIMIEPAISLETIGRVYKLISEIPYFANSRISVIEILPGGLTNSNYKVTIDEVTYAVRLAGAGTMEYLNRPAEKHNAQVMADIGISALIIYYDETTGNQVCKYIDDSKTLRIMILSKKITSAWQPMFLENITTVKKSLSLTLIP